MHLGSAHLAAELWVVQMRQPSVYMPRSGCAPTVQAAQCQAWRLTVACGGLLWVQSVRTHGSCIEMHEAALSAVAW